MHKKTMYKGASFSISAAGQLPKQLFNTLLAGTGCTVDD
jgi:hypothetical protein